MSNLAELHPRFALVGRERDVAIFGACSTGDATSALRLWIALFLRYPLKITGQDAFGMPTTEPFTADNGSRHVFIVQVFEKGRFEYHPENAGTPTEVIVKPKS